MLASTGFVVVGDDVAVSEVEVDDAELVDDDDGTDVFEVAPLHAVRATLKQAATTNGLTASAFMSLPEYAGRRSGMRVPVGGAVSCARSRPSQASGNEPGPQKG